MTYDDATPTSADSLSVAYNTLALGLSLEDQTGNEVSYFNVIRGSNADDMLTGDVGETDVFVYLQVGDGSGGAGITLVLSGIGTGSLDLADMEQNLLVI